MSTWCPEVSTLPVGILFAVHDLSLICPRYVLDVSRGVFRFESCRPDQTRLYIRDEDAVQIGDIEYQQLALNILIALAILAGVGVAVEWGVRKRGYK